ncbi:MAG TPA: hypothetical protein VGB63_03930 [Pedobacter sp.]
MKTLKAFHFEKPLASDTRSTILPKNTLLVSLFLPWLVSTIFQGAPLTSYLIAWLGSFFIFYQTWFSSHRYILPDLPAHQQIMRPIFLQQLIFAGFMCCTSLFYLLDTLGYKYFDHVHVINVLSLQEPLGLIAKCQRLSVLGHAAFVTGILLVQSKHYRERPSYSPTLVIPQQIWIIRICIVLFFFSIFFARIQSLSQFSISLYNAAIVSGAFIFVQGIIDKNLKYLLWGGGIFILNVINSTLSGFKEPILINFILIGCFLFPYKRRLVLIFSIPLFAIALLISSTYISVFRKHAWSGDASVEEARSEAFDTVFQEEEEQGNQHYEDNWDFLAHRLSEIGMFTEFVRTIPQYNSYYYTQLPLNALFAVIPRALWKDKPITETLAMERVYEAGVINRNSNVSAKTRPIVDGYVSAGIIGVILYMFFLGSISQWFCNKSENLFGGYGIGCIIIYNGFFQQLWRGETIEFMVNTVFWSFIAMIILFRVLKFANLLQKV